MVEALVWLLVFAPVSQSATQVVERFRTKEQCEHVLRFVNSKSNSTHRHGCVQANILVVK